MIPPYTIIKRDKAPKIYEVLKSMGCQGNIARHEFIRDADVIYVVINDMGLRGNLCFYKEGEMDPEIERTFISDVYEFLKAAAKYMNCTEY